MNVDFNKVVSFREDVSLINNNINEPNKYTFLTVLENAKNYYNKYKLFAIYKDGSEHQCDLDDINVLIKNYPIGG